MSTLLIAVDGYIAASEIKQKLLGEWTVYACDDGLTATELLEKLKPDALIVDLELPTRDGLSILMDQFPSLPPIVIGLSTLKNPYVRTTADSLGVHNIMEIPCDLCDVINHFNALYMTHNGTNNTLSMHLFKLGFSTKNDGYSYIEAAVPICAGADNSVRFQKEVYPAVMEKCHAASVNTVESSIRFSIKEAWRRRDPKVWAKYFPNAVGKDAKCPSCKVFISTLAKMI